MATQILNPTPGAVIFDNSSMDRAVSGGFDAIQRRRDMQQAQIQKDIQNVANSWSKNALTASEGRLWADEMAKIEAEHVAKGAELARENIMYDSLHPKAQAYREDRMRIENLQNFRKATEAKFNGEVKRIQSNKGKIDINDVSKLNDFVRDNSIQDIYNQGLDLPLVRNKFDLKESLQGYRAPTITSEETVGNQKIKDKVIDTVSAQRGILSRIGNSYRGNEYIEEITSGYPVGVLEALPDDKDQGRQIIEAIYASNPSMRDQIAVYSDQEVTGPDSPRYSEFINMYLDDAYNARGKFRGAMDDIIAGVSGGIDIGRRVSPDYTDRNQQLKEQANQRAWNADRRADTRFNERNQEQDYNPDGTEDTYVTYGVGSAGQETRQAPFNGVTRVNIPNMRVSVSEYIDMEDNGKTKQTPSIIEGTVVSFGWIPIINKGTHKGRVSRKGFAESNPDAVDWKNVALMSSEEKSKTGTRKRPRMVPIESIAKNLTKEQRSVYDQHMEASKSRQQPATQPSRQPATNTKFIGVPQGGF